ncbi:MAG: HU family DNA-binding protein [Paludibacteraceae bacterium]|nr:HU family DNA-binding protein [Paludibacteraceae bacterium]MBR1785546.1 HU family DNA-binding protein [Paludibacteraceae bacterium]
MNKSELVAAIAEKAGLTKAAAAKALDAAVEAIADSLKKGEAVQLIGFGTFAVAKREARQGVNPANGAKIQIPAKKVAKFKAGKALAEAL